MRRTLLTLALMALVPVLSPAVQAEVVRLEVRSREPYAGGEPWGPAGPYELLRGVAHYAVDPALPANAGIVDLKLAPRGAGGRVEFSADFHLLKPVDLGRASGALLYDVNNRGRPLVLGLFNRGPAPPPGSAGEAGDGFLLRRGYCLLWSGWIGEVLPGQGRLLLRAPVAVQGDRDITGPARFEMVCDEPAETLPLSRREGHGSYPPTERGEAEGKLTWRLREGDPRVPIPRAQWSLVRIPMPEAGEGVAGTLAQIRLRLSGGFQPGYLYELVYEARGPLVQGLGFAAVRDLVSYLRNSREEANPLLPRDEPRAPAVRRAVAFGVSQSGRFLREFLRQGFNADERGQKVFEALWPHVAGGGLGFFNHRFAQPTRHNGQHEEHLYPADRFPFTYGQSVDPWSGRTEAVLPRNAPPGTVPLVIHTQTSAEYWHRSGSLVHTDPQGLLDAEPPAGVRLYTFGGAQHGPAPRPPSRGMALNPANPADFRPFLRALLVAVEDWIREGKELPPSVHPRIAEGTLIDPQRYLELFPAVPGVRPPEVIQRPAATDHGPRFETEGIIDQEPPRVLGSYRVLVPRPDALGNDQGCLLLPEVAVPLATYTGWNLRARSAGAENQLASLLGSYLPLARTRKEREAAGDPRASLEELYGTFEEHLRRFRAVTAELVERRFLLPEDAEALVKGREAERADFEAPGSPPR